MPLSKIVVFVGESGDSDYEILLDGIHKTVIMKGVCQDPHYLHTNRKYPMEFLMPNPNMVETECGADAIKGALAKLATPLEFKEPDHEDPEPDDSMRNQAKDQLVEFLLTNRGVYPKDPMHSKSLQLESLVFEWSKIAGLVL